MLVAHSLQASYHVSRVVLNSEPTLTHEARNTTHIQFKSHCSTCVETASHPLSVQLPHPEALVPFASLSATATLRHCCLPTKGKWGSPQRENGPQNRALWALHGGPYKVYPPTHSEFDHHLQDLSTTSEFTHPFRIYPPLQDLPSISSFNTGCNIKDYMFCPGMCQVSSSPPLFLKRLNLTFLETESVLKYTNMLRTILNC